MNNITDSEYFVIRTAESNITLPINIDRSKGYTHVAITSCSIPKTYYVINYDTTLQVEEKGIVKNITILKGNYTVSNFASLFPSYTASAGTIFSYTVNYPDSKSVDESKYTFNVSGNAGIQPSFRTYDKYLAQVMGIEVGVWNTFSANKLVSPNALNFQSYDELLIKSDLVSNKLNLLQEIYSTANPYNSSIAWSNPSIELNAKHLTPQIKNVYNFSLTDMDGNLIDLNGSEWSIVICIFKTDNLSDILKKFMYTLSLKERLQILDN